jgi:hypothetical protein
MSYFKLIDQHIDEMNVAIQRFENTLGHGVRTFDLDVEESVICTIYPTAERAEAAYSEAVKIAEKVS